jgi:hypothetical protein
MQPGAQDGAGRVLVPEDVGEDEEVDRRAEVPGIGDRDVEDVDGSLLGLLPAGVLGSELRPEEDVDGQFSW